MFNSIKRIKSANGFTTVELAMVLIIFGFMVSGGIVALKYFTQSKYIELTRENMVTAESALFLYQLRFGTYPCPADPTIPLGNANFGRSECVDADGNGLPVPTPGRDVDNADGDNNIMTGQEMVLIGALPIATLLDPDGNPATNDSVMGNLALKDGYDGWKNKFTYAVTRDLTDHPAAPARFNHDGGAIFVIDENIIDITERPGVAHAVVVSHGENGRGAYNLQGNQGENCVDLVAAGGPVLFGNKVPRDDRENCDWGQAAITNARFLQGVHNDTQNDYNDDHVRFIVSNVTNLWEYSGIVMEDVNGTPGNPLDDVPVNQVTNTNGGNVGLGLNTPTERLHVSGDVQASEMHAANMCDTEGVVCMPPEAIGGDLPSMQCPIGEVVYKIEENKVHCTPAFDASIFSACAPGTFLSGFSSKTGPICVVPAP